MKKENFFLSLILFLAIIRGNSYLFIKNIINFQSPFEIIFFRFFITGIILSIFYFKTLLNINKHDILFGCLAGIFLFSAFAFQTYGLKYTTVSKQSFLTSLYIIFIPILEFILFKKKLKKGVIFFFFLILLGLLFISFKNFKDFELLINFGDFLTIICALGFAANIILISQLKNFKINIMNITIVQMLTTGILSFIFQIIVEKRTIVPSYNFSILYLIFICTMLNFTIQNISQKHVPAHIMGLILSTEAIWGTIFAIIFLNEYLSLNFIIGIIFISIGIYFIQSLEKN